MHSAIGLWTLVTAFSSALATPQGFNYGATKSDGSLKLQADYEAEFTAAAALAGTDGAFTSARLYTMAQGSTGQPTEALAAALGTKTSLLLGLWASAGDVSFANELAALQAAIQKYSGKGLKLDGISVGSEDLYRISPTGILNKEFAGAEPSTLANYIAQVRATIKGTEFASTPVGHVDTWTAWVNGSNNAVIDACDFIGMDAYPYFQGTEANGVSNGANLLQAALSATQAAAGNKPVWVTETGWPVSGKTVGQAVPSPSDARQYWLSVGCNLLFGKTPTWWYTLRDADPVTPNPSFGLVGSNLASSPAFDLSCKDASSSSTSPSATPASTSPSSTASSAVSTVSSTYTTYSASSTGPNANPSTVPSTNTVSPSATPSAAAVRLGFSEAVIAAVAIALVAV